MVFKNGRSEQMSSFMMRSGSAGMVMIGRRHLAACRSSNKEARHNTIRQTNRLRWLYGWHRDYINTARGDWTVLRPLLLLSDQHEEETRKKKHIADCVLFEGQCKHLFDFSSYSVFNICIYNVYIFYNFFSRLYFFFIWFVVVQSYRCRNSC